MSGLLLFAFLSGGGGVSIHGQFHMTTEDGSESAEGEFAEYTRFDSPTAIGIVYFRTNSTGILAPLDNMIGVFVDEQQPNGDSITSFFECKSDGASIGSGDNHY